MWVWIAQLLLIIIGPLIWQAVQILGFSIVAYEGYDLVISYVRDHIISSFTGLPSASVQILSLMKVDVSINIILSSITVKFLLAGVRGGRRKTTVWNPPGTGNTPVKMPF